MVTLTARQSVILKCNMQASVLLGNYEFYYAAGLFCNIERIAVNEDLLPEALWERMLPKLQAFDGEDARERYLVKLLLSYRPLEEYDEQMKELLQWGLSEKHIWQVNIG